jgi:hypothetical protein
MNDNEQRNKLEQAIKQNQDEWRMLHDRFMMIQEQKSDTIKEILRLLKMVEDLDAHAPA